MSCFFAGNATRLCDANGRWTGSEPKCQPIACGDPVTFPHTTVALINGSTSWKARAQYSCIFGYQPLNTKGNLTNHQRKPNFFIKAFCSSRHMMKSLLKLNGKSFSQRSVLPYLLKSMSWSYTVIKASAKFVRISKIFVFADHFF